LRLEARIGFQTQEEEQLLPRRIEHFRDGHRTAECHTFGDIAIARFGDRRQCGVVEEVLGLGLGVCRAAGRGDSGMAGFGTVALISIVPITLVILLTFWLASSGAGMAAPAQQTAEVASVSALAWEALVLGSRAIIPIFVFLYVFLRYVLKETEIDVPALVLGAVFANIGLFLFNFGLSVGLAELGNQVGHRLPLTFHPHPPELALYSTGLGKVIVVVFGLLLGYGATLAEPAFNVLGAQVEEVTQGAFKKWLFSQAVAIGVGIGAALGMVSLIYGVDLLKLLLPPYIALFILTLFNAEKYVNIGWDGGAVTTGPVTVPLKVTIGIALAHATGFAEGFGVLALASAYPVLNILLIGLYVKIKGEKTQAAEA